MKQETEIILAVLAYSLCSGTLVLINKLILHYLPYPSSVVTFQLVATIIFIYVAKYCYHLPVDDLKWVYVVPYLYYIIAFSLGVYCNMKSLSISNVETVIVFRALCPCFVSLLDTLFLGREYPSMRSWIAMGTIVAGTYGYASFDTKFQTQGWSAYTWPFLYLILISFEMAYGKRIIRSVDLKTLSGPVLYTNLLGVVPMMILGWIAGEPDKFHKDHPDGVTLEPLVIFLLFLGCVAGTGIGYSSWWCRDKVSATTFSLIGVMNKCLTIFINFFIWDQHAPIAGIACLSLCLVGGAFYQQAPLRHIPTSASKEQVASTEDVWDSDVSGTEIQNVEEQSLLKQRK